MTTDEIMNVVKVVYTDMLGQSPVDRLAYFDAHVSVDDNPSAAYLEARMARAELLELLGQQDAVTSEFMAVAETVRLSLSSLHVAALVLAKQTGDSHWYFTSLQAAIGHGFVLCGHQLREIVQKFDVAELPEEKQLLVRLAVLHCWQHLKIKEAVPTDIKEAVDIIRLKEAPYFSPPPPPGWRPGSDA